MEESLFDNQVKDPVFDQFNYHFREKILSICPLLGKFQIRILPTIDLIEAQIITEEEIATQAFLNHIEKTEDDASQTLAYIVKNEEVIKMLDFTLDEQFSAIAHEIGHFLFFFHSNKEGAGGQSEEIIADKYACDLGLKEPLMRVLNKLQGTTWYSDGIYRQITNRLFWLENYL